MTNAIIINTPGGPVQVGSAEVNEGDNVLIINTPAGPVAYASGTISPGDNVLVVTTPAGLVAVTDGAPGSATGGTGGTGGSGGTGGTGGGGTGPGLTYGGKQVTCIKITDGFVKPAIPVGVTTDLGSITFDWDGNGQVFIASNCQANPDTDRIWNDDELIVTNTVTGKQVINGGSPSYGTSSEGVWNSLDLNITNILQEGENTIDPVIHDVSGDLTGCSSLYIIQIADSDTPPAQPGIGSIASNY